MKYGFASNRFKTTGPEGEKLLLVSLQLTDKLTYETHGHRHAKATTTTTTTTT
jgi:hypothetical protein